MINMEKYRTKGSGMNYLLVKRDSDEWYFMWNLLAAHPCNESLPFPLTALCLGEEWQYMSTSIFERPAHHFRHRCHPLHGYNFRIEIPVSYRFMKKLKERGEMPKTNQIACFTTRNTKG